MQTSVNLQNLYSYSSAPLILAILALVFLTIYVYNKKNKPQEKLNKVETTKKIPEKNIKDIPTIKKRYLSDLNSIEDKYQNGKYDLRQAYQQISECVRMFVFEVTDIQTLNYTLTEIKKLNITGLYDLIKEFYEPEFALKSKADFADSINKAKDIVKKWN